MTARDTCTLRSWYTFKCMHVLDGFLWGEAVVLADYRAVQPETPPATSLVARVFVDVSLCSAASKTGDTAKLLDNVTTSQLVAFQPRLTLLPGDILPGRALAQLLAWTQLQAQQRSYRCSRNPKPMETRGPGEPERGPDSAENSGCQPSSLPLALWVEGVFCMPQRTVLGRERLQVMKIYRDLVGTRAVLLPHNGPVSPGGARPPSGPGRPRGRVGGGGGDGGGGGRYCSSVWVQSVAITRSLGRTVSIT